MPPTTDQAGRNPAQEDHYSKIKAEIDEKMIELYQENYKKLEFTPPEIAAQAGVNYNTAHKNGVFHKLKARNQSLDYARWNGITIDIEDWIKENNLLETEEEENEQ